MVFQLSFNTFTLSALKTDRIEACTNFLLIHVVVLVQDLDTIYEVYRFRVKHGTPSRTVTDRIWVVPIRSGVPSIDEVSAA